MCVCWVGGAKLSVHVCVWCVLEGFGGQWSDMLQGCYHSNSRMGQRVAMAPRSQGQREGPGGLSLCVCGVGGRGWSGDRRPVQLYWVC